MKGIVPSLNTPFSKKGNLDHNSLAKLVEHTIKSGCNGMLGLAVAGEGQSLSFEEKVDFIEIVKHTNKKRIPFIVNISDLQNEYIFERRNFLLFIKLLDNLPVCGLGEGGRG